MPTQSSSHHTPNKTSCLFLVRFGLCLCLGSHLTTASKARVAPSDAQLTVCTVLNWRRHVALGNLSDSSGRGGNSKGGRQIVDGRNLLELRLSLLGLVGDDDEASKVGLQALNVTGKALLAEVLAATIDRDTDSSGVLGSDAGSLELGNREASAFTSLAVVPDGRALDNRAECVDWPRVDRRGLGLTSDATGLLLAGLVKVAPHPALPVLAEMSLYELLIAPDRHCVEFDSMSCR